MFYLWVSQSLVIDDYKSMITDGDLRWGISGASGVG